MGRLRFPKWCNLIFAIYNAALRKFGNMGDVQLNVFVAVEGASENYGKLYTSVY
jgi:hypothetical protein